MRCYRKKEHNATRTAVGMVWIAAPTFPTREIRIAERAAILIQAGSVTLVSDTAPVTSEYVVTGAPPRNAARVQADRRPASYGEGQDP